MLDPHSSDFGLLVHNWCEAQRMNENIYIMNEFDNVDTRSACNFFRNRVLNSQLEEAKSAIRSINNDSDQNNLGIILKEENHPDETSGDQIIEQSNEVAHSLVQIQNKKLNKLIEKFDELSENEPNNDKT